MEIWKGFIWYISACNGKGKIINGLSLSFERIHYIKPFTNADILRIILVKAGLQCSYFMAGRSFSKADNTFHLDTPDIIQTVYVSMTAGDVLVTNRRQAIINLHVMISNYLSVSARSTIHDSSVVSNFIHCPLVWYFFRTTDSNGI